MGFSHLPLVGISFCSCQALALSVGFITLPVRDIDGWRTSPLLFPRRSSSFFIKISLKMKIQNQKRGHLDSTWRAVNSLSSFRIASIRVEIYDNSFSNSSSSPSSSDAIGFDSTFDELEVVSSKSFQCYSSDFTSSELQTQPWKIYPPRNSWNLK